ncbi:MAG: peptidylprolyl isomerase [Pelagimonas sp.]|jgi:peptidyl-prolyl cis-trans isomerase C|nr:peptidylprolyl isomerase [Pelagimonas sp.]
MSKTLMKLGAAAIALALAAPVHAEGDMTADSVVATVNGTEITLGHVLSVRAGLPEQYQQLPADVLWDGILDQLIQQEALAQDDLASETRRVRVALENERRSLLAAEALGAIAENAVSEEAIRAAYQADYADSPQGMEFNASHILVDNEESALEILKSVKSGTDFAEAAREHSTGPSGPGGGALGWFGPGMMVEPFQKAVESLEPGDITGPVQTQFGWHVIKLNETRIPDVPPLDAVREEIMGKLQQGAVTTYLEDLVNGADVTRSSKDSIDLSILNKIELLEE